MISTKVITTPTSAGKNSSAYSRDWVYPSASATTPAKIERFQTASDARPSFSLKSRVLTREGMITWAAPISMVTTNPNMTMLVCMGRTRPKESQAWLPSRSGAINSAAATNPMLVPSTIQTAPLIM